MSIIKFVFLQRSCFFVLTVLFFVSCVTGDPVECITALDCEDGYNCVDGWCVEKEVIIDTGATGETGETGNTGGTGNDGETGSSGFSGDDSDSEKPDIVEVPDDYEEPDEIEEVPDIIEVPDDYEKPDEGEEDPDVDEEPDDNEEPDEGPTIRTDQACTGLPSNASWNTVSSITQTWSGSEWLPTTAGVYSEAGSVTECRFKCNTNYTWNAGNSTCGANVRYDQACTSLPSNASWNTVSSITQTWSGTVWLPTTTGVHNETPSEMECRYKCNPDYHWNGSTCISSTKTFNCAAKPSNTEWNMVSSYTQSWNGSNWIPADSTTHYNLTETATACHYKCSAGHHWNGTTCILSTKTFTCAAKPSNTDWNTVSSYTQSWNGSAWVPADSTTHYNVTETATACHYKCSSQYYWSGSACVECTDNGHCGGGTPRCKTDPGICVECLTNGDCAGELVCNANNQCADPCPSNIVLATWNSGDDGWSRGSGWQRFSPSSPPGDCYSGSGCMRFWGSVSGYTSHLSYGTNVDLGSCGSATLNFYVRLVDWMGDSDLSCSEKLRVSCSGNGGSTWTNIVPNPWPAGQSSALCSDCYCDGTSSSNRSFGWTAQTVSIPEVCRTNQARFRFTASGNSANNINYWYVDEVIINKP